MHTPQTARLAVLMLFFFHGIMIGGWVTHIPLAKQRLEVGPGIFGFALLSFALGAVISMPLSGAAMNSFGSARLSWILGICFAGLLFAPALAPALLVFHVGGVLLGASIGSMDVARD